MDQRRASQMRGRRLPRVRMRHLSSPRTSSAQNLTSCPGSHKSILSSVAVELNDGRFIGKEPFDYFSAEETWSAAQMTQYYEIMNLDQEKARATCGWVVGGWTWGCRSHWEGHQWTSIKPVVMVSQSRCLDPCLLAQLFFSFYSSSSLNRLNV